MPWDVLPQLASQMNAICPYVPHFCYHELCDYIATEVSRLVKGIHDCHLIEQKSHSGWIGVVIKSSREVCVPRKGAAW